MEVKKTTVSELLIYSTDNQTRLAERDITKAEQALNLLATSDTHQ